MMPPAVNRRFERWNE